MTFPKGYVDDTHALQSAIERWVAKESQTRLVDLRFHDWGKVVYAGPGKALDAIAASPDARALLEWCDRETGQRCTLLQAYAVLEHLGMLSSSQRNAFPGRFQN